MLEKKSHSISQKKTIKYGTNFPFQFYRPTDYVAYKGIETHVANRVHPSNQVKFMMAFWLPFSFVNFV